jgi:hypothetical protein
MRGLKLALSDNPIQTIEHRAPTKKSPKPSHGKLRPKSLAWAASAQEVEAANIQGQACSRPLAIKSLSARPITHWLSSLATSAWYMAAAIPAHCSKNWAKAGASIAIGILTLLSIRKLKPRHSSMKRR